jgi:predicted TPR repeat methyltransferase
MQKEAGPDQALTESEQPTAGSSAERSGVDPDEALAQALAIHKRGHPGPAAVIYQRILDVIPEHVDALQYLGIAAHQLGKSDDALALMNRAIELRPDGAELYNNLGNILRQTGRLKEARASYERALVHSAEHIDALTNLGSLARAEGRAEEAVDIFRRVLVLSPDHVEAHHNLGNALFDLGRAEESLQPFRRALLLRPYEGSSYMRVGAALNATGRTSEAAELYAKWLALEPDNPLPSHLLAACTGKDTPSRASNAFVQRTFDRFAASFDKVLALLDYKAPALIESAIAETLGSPNGSLAVLDAGCGTGLAGPLLRPYASRLVGVDLSEEMLVHAVRRNAYDDLVQAELTAHLELHRGEYDLIASVDTLVYFGDLVPVARGFAHAVRAQGHAAFSLERADPEQAPLGHRLNPHGRYSHSQTYVEQVFFEAGFEVRMVREVEPRTEAGKPVSGLLVVAKKR